VKGAEGVERGEGTLTEIAHVFHGGPKSVVEALDGLFGTVEGTKDRIHCWERFTETLDVERVEIGSDVEPEFDGEMVIGGGHGGRDVEGCVEGGYIRRQKMKRERRGNVGNNDAGAFDGGGCGARGWIACDTTVL
jgi:hypothetical protein